MATFPFPADHEFSSVQELLGGIPHIQFNVVSSEELREAQAAPEEHSELMVRVAGYSAHFIDLSEDTQDSIIERTEQAFS